MTKLEQIDVYTLEEIIEKFGIPPKEKQNIVSEIQKGTFPIPALKIRHKYLFPKKPIDDFLKGYNPQSVRLPWQKKQRGRPRKWLPTETVHLNFPVPADLNEKFDMICKNINKTISAPLSKGDFLRIAIEEFIERRPEFSKGGEK